MALHPSVLSGYEELLEVAEAILFSVPLPPNVLDKYKLIQKQVKEKIQDAVMRADDPSNAPSLRSSLHGSASANGDGERAALLSEKLQHSKRKNAELRAQMAALESELSQMTLRVQQLHSLHASSSAELVAQTKHACEAAAARQVADAEARHKHEASVARQLATEALDAERAFRNDVVRKVRTVEDMFPAVYADSRPHQQQQQHSSATGATGAQASSDNSSQQSLSSSQSHVSAFLETTRRALHSSQQLRREVLDAQSESRMLRARAPIDAEFQYGVAKAGQQMSAKVVELQEQLLGSGERRSTFLVQRDDIVARVDDIEARMQQRATQPTARTTAPAAPPSAHPSPPPATAAVSLDEHSARGPRGSRYAGQPQQTRRRVQLPPTLDDEKRADEAAVAAAREADQQADRQVAHIDQMRARGHDPSSSRRWEAERERGVDADQEQEEEEEEEADQYTYENHDDSAATDEQCDVVPSLLGKSARIRFADA